MSVAADRAFPVATTAGARTRRSFDAAPFVRGGVAAWLGFIVVLPLAAVAVKSMEGGWPGFWEAVTQPRAVASLVLSLGASVAVVLVNAVFGTLIAWVLVRDKFPGKAAVDALIDLPFALPTIVAGLTLIALYGPKSPFGINAAYTRVGIVLALLFVTLPFVVRAVQPVLAEIDKEMEEAAHALGATAWTSFRMVVLPNLLPAIFSGMGLAFARAIGEFGSVVLISGNIPFRTEVAAVNIFTQVESNDPTAAAAVSVVLLGVSMAVLAAIALLERRGTRHERTV